MLVAGFLAVAGAAEHLEVGGEGVAAGVPGVMWSPSICS